MQIAAVQPSPEVVRSFLDEYFAAWSGTDESSVLAYYSDDVVLQLPMGTLEGKAAVRDNFVRPFLSAFPGNRHVIRNLAFGVNLVAVEWSFEAVQSGAFAGVPASGKQVQVPGCSMYEYDLAAKTITNGRIYFDVAALMRQLGPQ